MRGIALPGDPRGFHVIWGIPRQQLVRAILGFIGHGGAACDPVPEIVILQPVLLRVGELL